MVLDTSAILAILFNEQHARWVLDRIKNNSARPSMSTVNLSELLIKLYDKQPHDAALLEKDIFLLGIRFVPPTEEHAKIAAQARLRFPINLGDCFAYALAIAEDDTIISIDKDFLKTDAKISVPK